MNGRHRLFLLSPNLRFRQVHDIRCRLVEMLHLQQEFDGSHRRPEEIPLHPQGDDDSRCRKDHNLILPCVFYGQIKLF